MTPSEPRPALPEVVSTLAEYEREVEERWEVSLCGWCGQRFGSYSYTARFCEVECEHEHDLAEPPESFARSRCAYAAQRLRQRLQRAAGRPAGSVGANR